MHCLHTHIRTHARTHTYNYSSFSPTRRVLAALVQVQHSTEQHRTARSTDCPTAPERHGSQGRGRHRTLEEQPWLVGCFVEVGRCSHFNRRNEHFHPSNSGGMGVHAAPMQHQCTIGWRPWFPCGFPGACLATRWRGKDRDNDDDVDGLLTSKYIDPGHSRCSLPTGRIYSVGPGYWVHRLLL
jgi:hypothetical protein